MLCKNCHNLSMGNCCSNFQFNEATKNIAMGHGELAGFSSYTEEANTKELACVKCGSKQIQIKTYQSRSADESVTMSIYCIACGHRQIGESITNG